MNEPRTEQEWRALPEQLRLARLEQLRLIDDPSPSQTLPARIMAANAEVRRLEVLLEAFQRVGHDFFDERAPG